MSRGRGDNWNTPPEVVELLCEMWPDGIDLDPCSNEHSMVPARVRWTKDDNGLVQAWGWADRIYVNPPYSKPRQWMDTCDQYGGLKSQIIALVKGDWSVSWWRDYVWRATAICFISKRLAFYDRGKRCAGSTFPNALVYWGTDVARFCEVFGKIGKVITLRQ